MQTMIAIWYSHLISYTWILKQASREKYHGALDTKC